MDFLEIRKKAKERAAAGKAGAEAKPAPEPAAKKAKARKKPAPKRKAEPGLLTESDVTEGRLAAQLGAGRKEPIARAPEPGPAEAEAEQADAEPPGPLAPSSAEALAEALSGGEGARRAAAGGEEEQAPPRPRDALSEFFFDPQEAGAEVPELALPLAPQPAAAVESEERREYLSFLLGDEEYAVGIESVREIVKPPPITEVPRAPAHILGVITLRGEVIAVFDLRRRLGLPPGEPGPRARIVICDAGEGPCGIVVDAVSQVVRLPPAAIEPRPQGVGGVGAEFLAGIGRGAERGRQHLYILLDVAAVLRRDAGKAPARAAGKGAA